LAARARRRLDRRVATGELEGVADRAVRMWVGPDEVEADGLRLEALTDAPERVAHVAVSLIELIEETRLPGEAESELPLRVIGVGDGAEVAEPADEARVSTSKLLDDRERFRRSTRRELDRRDARENQIAIGGVEVLETLDRAVPIEERRERERIRSRPSEARPIAL